MTGAKGKGVGRERGGEEKEGIGERGIERWREEAAKGRERARGGGEGRRRGREAKAGEKKTRRGVDEGG